MTCENLYTKILEKKSTSISGADLRKILKKIVKINLTSASVVDLQNIFKKKKMLRKIK